MSGWAFFYAFFGAANVTYYVADGMWINIFGAVFCACAFVATLVDPS